MKLTVIICVYNTDKSYLDECLSSITHSSLASAKLCDRDDIGYEILMIDDGSTEDYRDLVDKYGVRYVKTENRGIFTARALGVELADGDFITFCDSDDTVSFNYHLPMLMTAELHSADIVINDWAFHSRSTRYFCGADSTINSDLALTGENVLLAFAAQEGREHSYYVLWNKIYSAPILKSAMRYAQKASAGIARFNYSEDALINFYAFREAKTLQNVHTGYYFYRIHSTQSVNVTSRERLISQIDMMALTLRAMRDGCADSVHREELIAHINEWASLISRTHYSYAKSSGYEDLFPYIKEKYGVSELARSTVHDGEAYSKNRLLPENFTEIDNALFSIWQGKDTHVRDLARIDYTRRSLKFIENAKGIKITSAKEAVYTMTTIPKAKIPLKKRIIYNHVIYRIGMRLFKKGGRLRAFLKKRI